MVWFLKKKKREGSKRPVSNEKTKRKEEHPVIQFSAEGLKISSIGFFPSYSKSPNGKYIISGYGNNYVLLEDNNLLITGKVQGSNNIDYLDIHVANNGTFVLPNTSSFFAITKEGNEIIKRLFNASPARCGISDDGEYAICMTAASSGSDSNKFFLWDLSNGSIISQWPEELRWWPHSYQFDTENKLVYFVYENFGKFAYSFDGEFIDKGKYNDAILEKGSGFQIMRVVKEQLERLSEKIDTDTGIKLITSLEKALERDKDIRDNAIVYRTKGEIFERLNDKTKAIENYEKALELNPKIGVKKKLISLKKEK